MPDGDPLTRAASAAISETGVAGSAPPQDAGTAWPSAAFQRIHRSGALWSALFEQLVADELTSAGPQRQILDVGAGAGVDGDLDAQRRVAGRATSAVAVEPDLSVAIGSHFGAAHRTTLEQAPIPHGSIHLAVAFWTVEHVAEPKIFFRALRRALKPGGVAIIATLDARSPLGRVGRVAERLGRGPVFDRYALGRTGAALHMAANTPSSLQRSAVGFRRVACWSRARIGDHDALGAAGRAWDRVAEARGAPGRALLARLET